MLQVRLIHHCYLSARNGANTVMNALLASKEQFERNGILLESLSPDSFRPRSFESNSKDANTNNRRAKIKLFLKNLAQKNSIAAAMVVYLSDLRPAKKISSFYVNSNPNINEIVFFHSLIPCYYYLKLRRAKQKTVLVCHTNGDNFKMFRIYYPALEHSFLYKKMKKMEDYVLQKVDFISFVSNMSMNCFLDLHPWVDPQKVSFIYNGVPDVVTAERRLAKPNVTEFCCVASISKRKGQHYIIDALKMFKDNNLPKVHFTIVGDGSDRALLEKQVSEYGLSEFITFAGLSHNVDSYLVNSDVYILPSEDEGLPMAIIEAMRASLPIVATKVGGIPEMINHNFNGLLIEPSEKDVYDVIVNVDKIPWKRMGMNARNTYKELFSIEKMVDGYIKLLSKQL